MAELLDPDGVLFHRVIANSASADSNGMPIDQLKSFSRVCSWPAQEFQCAVSIDNACCLIKIPLA